jgi:hypothetical protein
MKTLATILGTIAPATACAASGPANKVFVSGPLIMLFLGFCALVVVIQCIPALIMFYGMIKGLFSVVKEETESTEK